MDTAVKERLVGAAVLVVVVVLVVPALLTGPRPPAEPAEPASGDTRVVEIDLSGNGDARSAASPSAEEPAAGSSQADAPAPAQTAEAVPEPAPAVPPEARPAPASVAVAPAPATEAPPPAGWTVQVAALSRADAARDMAASLKRRGYAAFVLEHRSGDRVLYRVRVGPEAERDRAEALARRLTGEGFKPTVVAPP